MRKESKASSKVAELLASKVDASKLYMVSEPNLHEKLVLELAVEVEKARDPRYVMVSCASQEEAAAYFNKHGFVDTLDHMLDMRKRNKEAQACS